MTLYAISSLYKLMHISYSFSGKVPRSPDENDRTELLRQAEPVDYMGDTTTDSLDDYMNMGLSAATGYQSQHVSQAPSRYSSVGRMGHKPPKGIFDDV